MRIDGPQGVYGGVNASGAVTTINYGTGANGLEFRPRDENERFKAPKLLDVSLQKTFSLGQERYRLKIMLDLFNALNDNSILSYGSNSLNSSIVNSINSIVPPRVFRIGATLNF